MKKKSKPLISIGLPAHNGEQVISDAIESLLHQTYKNFELIISDDASTDRTQKICEAYAQKDKRILYICQKKNLGFVDNFNFVLQKAKGKFFMWAGQDDIRNKNSLQILLKLFYTYPDIVLSTCGFANIDKERKQIETYPSALFDNSKDLFYSVSAYVLKPNLSYFYGLFKTGILKKTGGYIKDSRPFFKSSDYVTILKVLFEGKMAHTRHVLLYKRDTGFYFKKYSSLKYFFLDRRIRNKIIRYLFFPLFFVYDFALTIQCVFLSQKFSLTQKISLLIRVLISYIKRNIDYVISILKSIIYVAA